MREVGLSIKLRTVTETLSLGHSLIRKICEQYVVFKVQNNDF